jgi:hypothetical protein
MNVRFIGYSTGEATCVLYTLRIYDENYIGSTPQATFVLEAPGFERVIEPNENTVTAFGVMASSVAFNISVAQSEVVVNNWLRNELPLAQENRYHLEILKGSAIYWRGTLLADGLRIPEQCGEYSAQLTFTDGLSALNGFENMPPLGPGRLNSARYVTFVQSLLRNVPAINLWGENDTFLQTSVRWFDELNATNEDPLFQNHLLPDGVLYSVLDAVDEFLDSPSYLEQLDLLARAFHCRLFQDNGVWQLLQVDAYNEANMLVYEYNRKSVFVGTSINEALIQKGPFTTSYETTLQASGVGFPFFEAEITRGYKPALKSAIITLEDEVRPIAETLNQLVSRFPRLTVTPPQLDERKDTWFNGGLVQIIPDAAIRIFGRVRFYELSINPLPQPNRSLYFSVEVQIDNQPAYIGTVNVPIQQFQWVNQPNINPYRYEYFAEFDLAFNTQIPRGGNVRFRVINEGTLETGVGYIANWMDIRANLEYIRTSGSSDALVLDYISENTRPIKSSVIYKYSTPLGDVITLPGETSQGYADKGALFVPIAQFPFRDFCGRWSYNKTGPQKPILSLMAERLVMHQNLPTQEIEARLVGDAWPLRNKLLYNGRRFMFNGGTFVSDDETWNVRLIEIQETNPNQTFSGGIVREPGFRLPAAPTTLLPGLDVLRMKGVVLATALDQGDEITELQVLGAGLSEMPSGGNVIVIDPSTGGYELIAITGKAEIISTNPLTYSLPVNHSMNVNISAGSNLMFDAEAVNSIMPRFNLLGESQGNLRALSVVQNDEQYLLVLQTTSGDFTINIEPVL